MNNLNMAHYYLNTKMIDEYENYCERIYKNIHGILKSELADGIEKFCKNDLTV
jgi:hypothetical protein